MRCRCAYLCHRSRAARSGRGRSPRRPRSAAGRSASRTGSVPAMLAERALRPGLLAVAASAAFVGVPALVAPHAFFRGFPFVAHWVDRLGDYNEHLTTDVGTVYLAVAALFVRAAVTLDRSLVLPLCLAWAAAQALHLAFH